VEAPGIRKKTQHDPRLNGGGGSAYLFKKKNRKQEKKSFTVSEISGEEPRDYSKFPREKVQKITEGYPEQKDVIRPK